VEPFLIMFCYRIKTAFSPEWKNLFHSLFGDSAVCCASLVNESEAFYGFETEQTPADLGPLVCVERVESIPNL
jgi:hypothetical protein